MNSNSIRNHTKTSRWYNKAIPWIMVLVLLLIAIIMLHTFALRIFVRWGGAFISFIIVAYIFYYFLGIFPSLNKRVKYLLTVCMIIMSIFVYYEFNKPRVVHMKEDVMYILPKSDTTRKK